MNTKDYLILIKEFGESLPHELYFSHLGKVHKLKSIELDGKNTLNNKYPIEICYPYLRPMSSMTDEENRIYDAHRRQIVNSSGKLLTESITVYNDFLNAHHIDYCGLIPMGLALEAPEDMYKLS